MKVWLFKSTLDSAYFNVVDFIKYSDRNYPIIMNYKAILLQAFKDKFVHKETNEFIRSFKRSEDLTSITLYYKYFDIRDYNYCIISYEEGLYFYFINNIISNNDNVDNPSCTLTLEWDVWNNNIDDIIKSKNSNNIEISHFDRYRLEDDNFIHPNFYKVDGIEVPHTVSEKWHFSKYIPVFKVFQVNEFPKPINSDTLTERHKAFSFEQDLIVDTLTFTDTYIMMGDALEFTYNRNLIYSLYGIFDIELGDYVECEISMGNNKIPTYNPVQDRVVDLYLPYNSFVISKPKDRNHIYNQNFLNYVESIYLTFNSPFEYNVRTSSTIPEIEFVNNPVIQNGSSILGSPLICGGIASYREMPDNDYTMVYSYYPIQVGKKEYPINFVNSFDANVTKEDFSINSNFKYIIDPIYYNYPFSYFSIISGNTIKDIYPLHPSNEYIKLIIDNNTPQTQYNLIVDNKTILPTNEFTSECVPFSYGLNAEDSYYIRNGSQHEIAKALSRYNIASSSIQTIGNIVMTIAKSKSGSVTPSDINGIVGGVDKSVRSHFDFLKLKAFETDLSNTPGTWYPSTGECDYIYQDRIRVIKRDFMAENFQFKEYTKNVYWYGYDKMRFDNVFTNYRYTFDFCKTTNCELPDMLINNSDRIKLCSIFDRGVTKWHILIDENGDIIHFQQPKKSIEDIGNNIEHKFETNPTFRTWVNS